MSVKTRIQELNSRLIEWLNKRGIETDENETTTSLINKTIETPLTFNQMSLMPKSSNTTEGLWSGETATETSWNDDGTVTYETQIDGYPCIKTTYNVKMQVPDLNLFVDASHSNKFNMMLHWHGHDDNVTNHTSLSSLSGRGSKDFLSPRTTKMVDFESTILATGHTNPPIVDYKYDLLKKATGLSKNYVYSPSIKDAGGQRSFGKNSGETINDFLMGEETVDLTKTPYLYYSIQLPEDENGNLLPTADGCTFAIYSNDSVQDGNNTTRFENDGKSAWYMYRCGKYTDTDLLLRGGDNYDGIEKSQRWMFNSQTGCIDLRKYVSNYHMTDFKVTELKFYGNYNYSLSNRYADPNFNFTNGSIPFNLVPGLWYTVSCKNSDSTFAQSYSFIECVEENDYYVLKGYNNENQLTLIIKTEKDSQNLIFDQVPANDLTYFSIAEFIEDSSLLKTECTFNYLFFGSEATNAFIQGQRGECAYLKETNGVTDYTNVYHPYAAIGGPITLEYIDYYVVGKINDKVTLRAVAITRPYNYIEE